MAVNITTQPTGGTWYKGANIRLYCYANSTYGGSIDYQWSGTGDFS